jgi:hypothetical protein
MPSARRRSPSAAGVSILARRMRRVTSLHEVEGLLVHPPRTLREWRDGALIEDALLLDLVAVINAGLYCSPMQAWVPGRIISISRATPLRLRRKRRTRKERDAVRVWALGNRQALLSGPPQGRSRVPQAFACFVTARAGRSLCHAPPAEVGQAASSLMFMTTDRRAPIDRDGRPSPRGFSIGSTLFNGDTCGCGDILVRPVCGTIRA